MDTGAHMRYRGKGGGGGEGDRLSDSEGVRTGDWLTGPDAQSDDLAEPLAEAPESDPVAPEVALESEPVVELNPLPDTAPAGQANPPAEEKQCRICLGGVEEEAELGRLFRPCKCKGSMQYVHVECLNLWRKSSASRKSFWACDQCKYSYSLARTRAVGLATSPVILATTTLTLFTIIVFLASFVVSYFVPDLDPSSTTNYLNKATDRGEVEWWAYSPVVAASDFIRLAVYTFNDFGIDENEGSFVWEQRASQRENSRAKRKKSKLKEKPAQQKEPSKPYEVPQGSRKRDKTATPPDSSTVGPESPPEVDHPPPFLTSLLISILSFRNNLILRIAHRFTLGLSFVGILSFVNLLFNFALLTPLRLRQRGWFSPRRNGETSNLGTIIVVLFVAIGVARAVYHVYRLNRTLAQAILARAETAILEVGEDEDVQPRAPLTRLEQCKESATNAYKWVKGLYWTAWTSLRRAWFSLLHDPEEPALQKFSRLAILGGGWIAGKVVEIWHKFLIV